MRLRMAGLGMVALFSAQASAQLPKCSNSGAAVARPCELDEWPLPDRQRLRPFYPDILRQAGASGEVLLRYVVDTIGKASVASMEVLRSTHQLFTIAVKNAVTRQRFVPALRGGVAASVTVEELVTFDNAAPGWTSIRQEQVIRHAVDSTGRLLTTVYSFTPRDSANAPRLTTTDSLEIYDVVIAEVTRSNAVNAPPAAWCVQLNGRAPSIELLEGWRRAGRRVVTSAECPRTYTRMFRGPADPDPPPGWIDPVHLGVDNLVSWAKDMVILTTTASQGTSTAVIRCEVVRVTGKWSQAYCVETERRIS